jgi:hypothetical protein
MPRKQKYIYDAPASPGRMKYLKIFGGLAFFPLFALDG